MDCRDLHRRQLLDCGQLLAGSAVWLLCQRLFEFFFEEVTHALAHLQGGGVGESDEQHAGDIAAFLGHLADDAHEVVRLARARACLDDYQAWV